jgi:hypothetical protein
MSKELAYKKRAREAIKDTRERLPVGTNFYYLDTLFIVTSVSGRVVYEGVDDEPIRTWITAEYMTANGIQTKSFECFDNIKTTVR